MMFKIRSSVFETNSSSTHSISFLNTTTKYTEIPKNTTIHLSDYENNCVIRGLNFTEWSKLNFLVFMALSFKYVAIDFERKQEELDFIDKTLNLIRIIIKEECNSELEIHDITDDFACFYVHEGYFNTVFGVDYNIDDYDFKIILKDIIFNKNKSIQDEYEEW
jgi:hypothetical protein